MSGAAPSGWPRFAPRGPRCRDSLKELPQGALRTRPHKSVTICTSTVRSRSGAAKVWDFLTDPKVRARAGSSSRRARKKFRATTSVGFGAVKVELRQRRRVGRDGPASNARDEGARHRAGLGVDATTSMTLTDGQDGATDLAWSADIQVVGTVASMAARADGRRDEKLRRRSSTGARGDRERRVDHYAAALASIDSAAEREARMQYPVSITVNGVRAETSCRGAAPPGPLLRETLGLTGTNIGCDTSQCGSCTV